MRDLYQRLYGTAPVRVERLSGAGSNREYYRLWNSDGRSVIGVRGKKEEENHAFVTLCRHFAKRGLNVPKLLAVSEDEMQYLQEDLGDTQLFDLLKTVEQSELEGLLERTLRALAHVQIEGAEGLDWSVCYPVESFNRRSVMWDLEYFKYCFLKVQGVELLEDRLENEFERLTDSVLRADGRYFMYRDFQSRNVMVRDGNPYFIDFQGGRRGPLQYDVVSFLWQARAGFSAEQRGRLIEVYLDEVSGLIDIDKEEFRESLNDFVLLRTLQVLGAYGYRGLIEKKEHFLKSIPQALQNLQAALRGTDYSYLQQIAEGLVASYPTVESKTIIPSTTTILPEYQVQPPLVVTVGSFSYKKGLPQDESGNGGGFVFDCRALHNPGKYEEYKHLTGKDLPVIQFLEERGEIQPYLEHCWALVDNAVERYLKRGFTSLHVWFGCTGGQHRSVYSAEHTAQHLREKYGVSVRLIHREQNH